MAWVVNVDFQGGAGWEDITSGVILTSFVRRRQIWNKLSPTVNTLDFKLKTESSSLIAKFMTASNDILVSVTKDSAAYFTGMVQPNYSVMVGSRITPFDISCVDNGYRIQRRITSNIHWAGYKVCNPAATASSILHQLMVAAGLSASSVYSSIVTIDKTIDMFVATAGEDEVWTMARDVLFDFGYTFYFRPDGTLDVQNFAPTSISTTNAFTSDPADTLNMAGQLKVERSEHDYEAVRVTWSTHKTLTDTLLFSDTTNGNAVRKCYISVASAAYWPDDSDERDIYAEYAIDGYELVATSGIFKSMDCDAGIVEDTFTDEVLRAKIKYHNSLAVPQYINRFDIYGDAIVKDQTNIQTRVMVANTNKYLDIESRYLYSAADANKLCDAVAQYYYNADMVYTLISRTEYEPGDYAYVEEKGFLDINNLCIVRERTDFEYCGEHQYILEGVAAYSAGSPTSTGSFLPPFPIQRQNVYTVASNGFAGYADAYCDGTADEVELNAAIDELAALGGGSVVAMGTQFNVASAIVLKSGIELYLDVGVIVERNGAYHAIEATGTSGTHLTNISITGSGTVQRKSDDTSVSSLIHIQYVDRLYINGVTISDAQYDHSIELDYCLDYVITATKQFYCLMGVHASYSNGKFHFNLIDGKGETLPTSTSIGLGFASSYESDGVNEILYNEIKNIVGEHHVYGIFVSNGGSKIRGNRIDALSGVGSHVIAGIQIQSADDCDIENNTVQDIHNTTSAMDAYGISIGVTSASNRVRVDGNRIQSGTGYGIIIDNTSQYTRILNNYCYANGSDTGFANTNSHNYYDNGVDTQISGNTWQ